jgi:ribonuclease D
MHYEILTQTAELNAFCASANQGDALAVDTEFVRTRTLYPQLGLIQLYDGKRLVLVDPQQIDDFSSLITLLTNPKITKVLHSCSEDLETFWQAFKIMPTPIFDTQVAASLLGMGTSLGYAKLVEMMLNVQVDKGESRTDWLARPLSTEQCAYAANDVLYLWQLFPQLIEDTIARQKYTWVVEEIAALAQKKQSQMPLEYAYLNISHNWQLSGKSLLILQRLAAWRMQVARDKDMSINFVVREQNLVEIARKQPSSKAALSTIPGINHHEIRFHAQAMLNIVAECQTSPAEQYPPCVERLTDFPLFKKVSSAVKLCCARVAQTYNIPLEVVGSKKQVNQLIAWCWFERDETTLLGLLPDLISGWRQPLFLQELLTITELDLVNKMRERHVQIHSQESK